MKNLSYEKLWKKFKEQHIQKPTIKDKEGYHHCVYVSRSSTRLYIGKHSCKKNPARSKYLGSSRDKEFKKNVFEKVVIAYFETSQKALDYEAKLQIKYQSTSNPLFANKAHWTANLNVGEGSKHPNSDLTVYTLYNREGKVVSGTQSELKSKLGFPATSINAVIKGKVAAIYGWGLSIEKAKKYEYHPLYDHTVHTLVNKEGVEIKGTQNEIAKMLGATRANVHSFFNPKSKVKGIKGFALTIEEAKKLRNKSGIKYKLKKGNQTFEGTYKELNIKVGIPKSTLCHLIKKNTTSWKGYKLVS